VAFSDGRYRATLEGARLALGEEPEPGDPSVPDDSEPEAVHEPELPVAELAAIDGCAFTRAGQPLLEYLRGRYPAEIDWSEERARLEEEARALGLQGKKRDAHLAQLPELDTGALNALMRRGFVVNAGPGRWRAANQAEAVRARRCSPPAGLRNGVLEVYVATGRTSKDQVAIARAQREREEREAQREQRRGGGGKRTPADDPDRRAGERGWAVAAERGKPISQKITAAEVARIRAALASRGGPTWFVERLGGDASTQDFDDVLRFVQTGDRAALEPEARVALAELTKEVKTSPALWPRKVAAAVWGLYLEEARA
jgi:hypothetical protein